jgi:geranylgeranyl diphosphate synthase type I
MIRAWAASGVAQPPAYPGRDVPGSLSWAASLIDGPMRRAVDGLAPAIRRTVSYHLGWSDSEGKMVEASGGKAVRPTLALLSAEAVGAPAAAAIPGAVAIELVHNFSLIHDDVMDGDRERRHRPAAWALFGVGQAIVAGDALLALAQQVLLDNSAPESKRAAAELARATARMIRGQSEDLAFESRLDVTRDECIAMSSNKTGALLGCATALGAILGPAPDVEIRALRSFGQHLGLAFQAVDDILGIWGDPAVTGKPSAGDLLQHKKTLPVVHALRGRGGGARELAGLLSHGALSREGLARSVELLDAARSREWTLELADRQLSLSIAALDRVGLRPRPAEALREVARFVVGRDF